MTYEPAPGAVGELARQAMATASLTQRAVAERLGMSQSQLSRRLAGKLPLNVRELDVIADMCGVTPRDLMPAERREVRVPRARRTKALASTG